MAMRRSCSGCKFCRVGGEKQTHYLDDSARAVTESFAPDPATNCLGRQHAGYRNCRRLTKSRVDRNIGDGALNRVLG
jgi:hypothetical protein